MRLGARGKSLSWESCLCSKLKELQLELQCSGNTWEGSVSCPQGNTVIASPSPSLLKFSSLFWVGEEEEGPKKEAPPSQKAAP